MNNKKTDKMFNKMVRKQKKLGNNEKRNPYNIQLVCAILVYLINNIYW